LKSEVHTWGTIEPFYKEGGLLYLEDRLEIGFGGWSDVSHERRSGGIHFAGHSAMCYGPRAIRFHRHMVRVFT
jgi:hypothetical protein